MMWKFVSVMDIPAWVIDPFAVNAADVDVSV